jgi:hypothetical protein
VSIARAIAEDDDLLDTVKADIPGTISSIGGMIDKGIDALTSVEASARRRLGGSAEPV